MPTATAERPLIDLLSVDQVANAFHVSQQSIRKWVSAGKLPAPIRVGRRLLFRFEDIYERLRNQ